MTWDSEAWKEAAREYAREEHGANAIGSSRQEPVPSELVSQCAADIKPEPVEWARL